GGSRGGLASRAVHGRATRPALARLSWPRLSPRSVRLRANAARRTEPPSRSNRGPRHITSERTIMSHARHAAPTAAHRDARRGIVRSCDGARRVSARGASYVVAHGSAVE